MHSNIKNIKKIKRGALASLFFLCLLSCQGIDKVNSSFIEWNVLSSPTFKTYPIIADDLVIIPGYCEDSTCLKAIDLLTGEQRWTHKENGLQGLFYNATVYKNEHFFCLPLTHKTLCVDIQTGKKKWEYLHDTLLTAEAHLSGFNEKLYRSLKKEDQHIIFEYSIHDGSTKPIAEMPIAEGTNSVLRTPIILNKNTVSLLTCLDEYNPANTHSSGQVILWDERGLKNILLEDFGITKANFQPIHYTNDLVLLLVNLGTLIMYDHVSHNVVWSQKMPHSILTSRIEIMDDVIYYPCEDKNLYALDAQNGMILWNNKLSGTPSKLAINKDYIFVTRGNNGRLNQYDRKTGKLLYQYKFKDYFRNFQRTIAT
jgi:outer membrane protein assembly factor BamB